MRLFEFAEQDKKLIDILETASGSASSAGAIASIASPIGGVVRRMPTEPNLFGYVPAPKPKNKRKKTKSKH
jgi:hypothetical protein